MTHTPDLSQAIERDEGGSRPLEVVTTQLKGSVHLHIIPPPKLQTRADLPTALSEVLPWLIACADVVAAGDTRASTVIIGEVEDILGAIDEGFRLNQVPAFEVKPIEWRLETEEVIQAIEALYAGNPREDSIPLLLGVARRAANEANAVHNAAKDESKSAILDGLKKLLDPSAVETSEEADATTTREPHGDPEGLEGTTLHQDPIGAD